jgi:Fic family protein
VADLLADVERFIHDDSAAALPPLVKIALVHAQFETIHPFLDGNGRLGRLIIPLFLFSHKLIARQSGCDRASIWMRRGSRVI